MEMVWSIIGAAVGVAGLVYAIMTNRAKANLEKLIRSALRGLAGNVENIRKNPGWADSHFGKIQQIALALDRSDQVAELLKETQSGARDAVAAERMLGNLLNEILSLQDGLFETKFIQHCDLKRTASTTNQSDAADGNSRA